MCCEKKITRHATGVLSGRLLFHEGFSDHLLVEHAKEYRNCMINPLIGGMTHELHEAIDIL